MCGIAGILRSSRRSDLHAVIEQMRWTLSHRGPDDSGVLPLQQGRGVLAHVRLSILDLSDAAHQPMSTADGRYWITYNGELYNFRELRQELERLQGSGAGGELQVGTGTHRDRCAARWKSQSDTEVILQAYARWGKDCVRRFRGMFAFAIWDEQEEELFLGRDSYGIKPLYYYHAGNSFLFASEVRALLASGVVPRTLSQPGLISYLQSGSVQDPLTIVENVHSLLPGNCLSVKFRGNRLQVVECSFTNYCPPRIPNTQNPAPANRREAVTQLRSVLEDSIRAHLVSDVPVASFLSGGIDSTAIVALMSRVSDETPRTFNVSFDEANFSERSYADVIARKFNTVHENIRLTEEALIRLLPGALAAMDQPTMDGINTYVVAKSVRDAGIKVALSGLGGDELFAGYPSFRRAMQLNRIASAPSVIRRLTSQAGGLFTNGSTRYRKFLDLLQSDCTPYSAYSISRQLFSPAEITALMGEDVKGKASGVRRNASQFGIRNSQSEICNPEYPTPNTEHLNGDVINAVSRYELTGYMANTLLRDTDQMSMAHALEVRVPFVDPEVVNFVTALPGEWKMNGGRPKPLLVDALGDLLPEEIWRRRKMGFTLPFERWMQDSLSGDINGTLSQGAYLSSIGIEPQNARSFWNAFKKKPQQQSWSRSWALYVIAKWCDLNDVQL